MKKKSERQAKSDRQNAVELVEQHIRESDMAPGFDYARAVARLRTRFTDHDIALACHVSKNTIGEWLNSGRIPGHDHGERLYILYRETFGEKPPVKKPN
jgi:hypothetical protein